MISPWLACWNPIPTAQFIDSISQRSHCFCNLSIRPPACGQSANADHIAIAELLTRIARTNAATLAQLPDCRASPTNNCRNFIVRCTTCRHMPNFYHLAMRIRVLRPFAWSVRAGFHATPKYFRTNCHASSAPYAVTATHPCDCRWVSQSRCSGSSRPPWAFSSMARPMCWPDFTGIQ